MRESRGGKCRREAGIEDDWRRSDQLEAMTVETSVELVLSGLMRV